MIELPYIRCRDLDGEAWTIASDSWFHIALQAALTTSPVAEVYLPEAFCRNPRRVTPDHVVLALEIMTEELHNDLKQYAFLDQAEQRARVWPYFRVGQSIRLLAAVVKTLVPGAEATDG